MPRTLQVGAAYKFQNILGGKPLFSRKRGFSDKILKKYHASSSGKSVSDFVYLSKNVQKVGR